jgi:alcohol dehydrogenase
LTSRIIVASAGILQLSRAPTRLQTGHFCAIIGGRQVCDQIQQEVAMKAAVFHGPRDVRVESVAAPEILAPTDAIVRITTAAICGSDLHLYRGRMPAAGGFTLGHEGVGTVEDIGPQITTLKRGQRVVVAGTVACGNCYYCRQGQVAQCEMSGAAVFGFGTNAAGKLLNLGGAQAQALRVPMADYTCFPIPHSIDDEAAVFLADILPTAYFGAVNGEIRPGDSVAIFGCGPVGLCAVMTAALFGPSQIFAVDAVPYRLEMARKLGATPIRTENAAEEIMSRTAARGADVAIEAVGNESALQAALIAVRPGGTVSAVGVFSEPTPSVPAAFLFARGLTLRVGLANIRSNIPRLAALIEHGKLDPRQLVSHRMALADAPRGYEIFEARTDNAVKVLLKP